MQFAKQLRQRVIDGDITTSIRIWQSPRVKPGGRYRLGDGHVVVEQIRSLAFDDITPDMARASGFGCVAELLRTAVHGSGRNVYFVTFHYEESEG